MDASTNPKRLYKSRVNRMIDGVCGGIAEYFGLDPTLVRIVWVLLTILGGSGILLYIAGMIIIPTAPLFPIPPAAQSAASPSPSSSNHKFWGILLVVVGTLWLLSNMGIWHRWWSFSWDVMLPLVLVLAGVAFLFGGRNSISIPVGQSETGGSSSESAPAHVNPAEPTRLYRSRRERKLFGVCGGLGTYFGIDPTIVRVLFVVSAFASFGITILAYIIMAIVVPEEPLSFTAQGV